MELGMIPQIQEKLKTAIRVLADAEQQHAHPRSLKILFDYGHCDCKALVNFDTSVFTRSRCNEGKTSRREEEH